MGVRPSTVGGLLAVALIAALPTAAAAPPGIRVVAIQGETLVGADGLPVATLGLPVTDGRGRLAFTGTLDDGDQGDGFVWRAGEILWRASSMPPPTPIGAAPFMGLGDDDEFVLRTQLEGEEALWSHHGPLLRLGDPAPGLPSGAQIEFNRRAMMTPGGTAFWVSQFRDGDGDSGVGRVVYVAADADPTSTEVVLRSDDLVAGLPIARPRGIDIEFRVSRNLRHLIAILELDTGSSQNDGALYVDGAVAVREGDAAGLFDRWSRFRRVSINDAGDYLFSATTDAPTGVDFVLAYNGEVAIREGQRLDDVRLRRDATILGLDLDDRGRAVHLWSTDGFGPTHLFFTCDAARLDDSVRLLTAPSPVAGMRLSRFNDTGFGPVLWLSPQLDRLYAQVELLDRIGGGIEPLEAIIEIDLPPCPTPAGSPTRRDAPSRW